MRSNISGFPLAAVDRVVGSHAWRARASLGQECRNSPNSHVDEAVIPKPLLVACLRYRDYLHITKMFAALRPAASRVVARSALAGRRTYADVADGALKLSLVLPHQVSISKAVGMEDVVVERI